MVPISLTSTAHAEVDYSKCAEFFNNNDSSERNLKGYRITRHNTPLPERARYIPFDIEDNGRLTVHDHAVRSVERDAFGNVTKETVSYLSHPIEKLEEAGSEGTDISNEQGTQQVKVIIERNNDGHITAITENVGLVTDDLSEIERMKDLHDGASDLAAAYIATRTEFKVAAGECVPTKQKELLRSERDGEIQEFEVLIFDTAICRKLHVFAEDYPEFRSAFDEELNDKLAHVLEEHARAFVSPGGSKFLTNEKVDQYVGERLAGRLADLRTQVLAGYMIATQMGSLKQKLHGMSAVTFGHTVLAECYYQRLYPFFWIGRLWPELKEE